MAGKLTITNCEGGVVSNNVCSEIVVENSDVVLENNTAIDCTIIGGDVKVVISQSTAIEALGAMQYVAKQGGYKNLPADDASFIRSSIKELEKACKK